MSDPDLTKRLSILSGGGSARPNNASRLRVHLKDIEGAQARGASLQQVLDAFNEGQGDNVMTLNSFKSALKRARKKLGEGSKKDTSAKPSMADLLAPPVRK
jgi:hypothetical protein